MKLRSFRLMAKYDECDLILPDKLPELYRKQFKVIICNGNRFKRREVFYKIYRQTYLNY